MRAGSNMNAHSMELSTTLSGDYIVAVIQQGKQYPTAQLLYEHLRPARIELSSYE